MAALDQTIVSTAGPTIAKALNFSPSLYPWITTSYLVASTVSLPIFGKLSDVFGRKPTLTASMLVFMLGSLLCGLSPSSQALVGARIVQGIGSAGLFANAFAVVADLFPPSERGKYQGLFGAVFGLSSVVGPLAGGFITDTFSWNWAFLINLPVGAMGLAFVFIRMPNLGGDRAPHKNIDWLGAASLILAVVPFLVLLSLGRGKPSTEAAPWFLSWPVLASASAVGLVAFLLAEANAKDPILDLRLFRSKAFSRGILATFVMGGCFLAAIVFLPLFMTNVVGLSATHTGLTTTPLTMGIVFGNILSGQWVSRLGRYKPIMLASNAVLIVGFAIMAFTLSPDSSQTEVTLKMILVGLGLGPSIPLFTLAIQNAVEPQHTGVATSSASFFRQIGSTVGVTLAGGMFAFTLYTGSPTEAPTQGEPKIMNVVTQESPLATGNSVATASSQKALYTRAISRVYQVALFMAVLGLLATVLLPELPLRTSKDHGPAQAVAE